MPDPSRAASSQGAPFAHPADPACDPGEYPVTPGLTATDDHAAAGTTLLKVAPSRCLTTIDALPWAEERLALRTGGSIIGLRCSDPRLLAPLRELLHRRVVAGVTPDRNLSLWLAPRATTGPQDLHRLYRTYVAELRTRSVARTVAALLHEVDVRDPRGRRPTGPDVFGPDVSGPDVSGPDVGTATGADHEAGPGTAIDATTDTARAAAADADRLIPVDATAVVRDGRAHLLHASLRPLVVTALRTWERGGFQVLERRRVGLDLTTAEVVVPEVGQGDLHLTPLIEALDLDDDGTAPVPAGRYPLASWTLDLDQGSAATRSARAAAQVHDPAVQLTPTRLVQLARCTAEVPDLAGGWSDLEGLREALHAS